MNRVQNESLVMRLTFAEQPVSVTFKIADIQVAWINSSEQVWDLNWLITVVPGDYVYNIEIVWSDRTKIYTDQLHVESSIDTGS